MPLSTQSVQSVKSIIDGITSEGKTGVPGLVFAAVDKSGNTLVEHASGTKSIDSKDPMDQDTTFWVASCTKIVTTIAALQLVEQGKLDLDDPETIRKYAPEIGKMKVYADGQTPAEQERPVTLRMCLAHTAGFAYFFLDPRVSMLNLPYVSGDEFGGDIKEILETQLVNQPGTMWEYAIGIDWAGIIIERATGLSLGDYFQKHIFEPLGVTDVTFTPSKQMLDKLSVVHQRDDEGNLTALPKHPYGRVLRNAEGSYHSGGAGLFAKPKEYLKILAALLNDGASPTTGGRILSEETVKMMWENQIPDQPNFARNAPPGPWPSLLRHSKELYPQEGDPPQGWGLSFFLTIAPGATGRGANTGWWSGLPNIFWWVDRERGVTGIIASQILPHNDEKVVDTWVKVEKAIYDGLEN